MVVGEADVTHRFIREPGLRHRVVGVAEADPPAASGPVTADPVEAHESPDPIASDLHTSVGERPPRGESPNPPPRAGSDTPTRRPSAHRDPSPPSNTTSVLPSTPAPSSRSACLETEPPISPEPFNLDITSSDPARRTCVGAGSTPSNVTLAEKASASRQAGLEVNGPISRAETTFDAKAART